MPDSRPVFPLRFNDARLRELVREIASRAHVSQNDLIEQAVLNDVVTRGELLTAELEAGARRLAGLTRQQAEALTDRGLEDFASGEGHPDPLAMRALHRSASASTAPSLPAALSQPERFPALAAFSAAP